MTTVTPKTTVQTGTPKTPVTPVTLGTPATPGTLGRVRGALSSILSILRRPTFITGMSMGLCILGIILYIAVLIVTSNYASSPEGWAKIKDDVRSMWIMCIFGMIFFIIAAFLLYSQYPENAVYISLLVSCVALGLSFNALAISAIRK